MAVRTARGGAARTGATSREETARGISRPHQPPSGRAAVGAMQARRGHDAFDPTQGSPQGSMMRPSRQQHSASPHPSPQKATASSAAFAAVSSPHAPAGRQPGVDDKENLDCSLLPRLLPTPETIDKHPAGHPAVASRAAKRSRVQGKLALAAAARSMLTFFRFLLFITIKYLRIFSIFVVYN